ncbi:MAG TPA: ComEC/Rec2 family competence protein [Acidimicrobiia bacterium]|nr:ComEC/Rec2 family competence protein [Acidimicrobiia bacterium]
MIDRAALRAAAGPLVALGGLVAGVAVGVGLGAAPAAGALGVGGAGLVVAWWTTSRVRLIVATVALVVLGSAVTQRALDGAADAPVRDRLGTRLSLVATVARDPTGAPYSTSLVLRVHGVVDDPSGSARPTRSALVYATGSGDAAVRLRVLTTGDRVVVSGVVRPLGAADDWLRWRHVVARLDGVALADFVPATSPLFALADRLRAVVLRGTAHLPLEQRAQVAGFVLGDTRELPRDLEQAYRDAGLSHLLVVSGANVAFALALAGPLLRRLPIVPRFGAGVGVVLLFATMTRFEPSVLRASVLAATVMFTELVGRPVARLRALSLAVMALVVVDPFLVFLPGFILSCAATAGIALWARPIAGALPGPRVVRDAAAVSLAAQVGVAPVLLARFGEVRLVAPIANLLAAPAAEPLGVLGLAGGALAGVVAPRVPAVGALVAAPLRVLVDWVSTIARAGATVPFVLDRRTAIGVVACAAAAAAVARGRGGSLRRDASRSGRSVPDTPAR